MTCERMIVSDEQFLDILVMARNNGGLAMVHAENNAMIKCREATQKPVFGRRESGLFSALQRGQE